ncbi:MAG: SIS domain-containing protein [Actinomycetes bacterium]
MSVPSHTEREILSQPDVWRETLASLDVSRLTRGFDTSPADVVVTGCGSTHYLALTVASLLRAAGVRAWATPASELLAGAAPQVPDPQRTLMLAFSRSGTTTETMLAVEQFRCTGGRTVVAVTCYPDSALAQAADVVWTAEAAAEQSVAQTRSFSSMLVLGQAIAAAVGGQDVAVLHKLPDHAARLLDGARAPMAALARDAGLSSFYFLASDPLFGVASEAMLKLKEMSLTASEAYHSMEFRHGPMSMCDAGAAVLGLVSPERSARELAVISDVAPMSGRVVTIGNGLDHDVPSSLPVWARPALYLLPLQLMALERALGKGLDPDSPRHLTAVIHLDASPEAS